MNAFAVCALALPAAFVALLLHRRRLGGRRAVPDDVVIDPSARVDPSALLASGVVVHLTRVGFKLTWPYPCKPEPRDLQGQLSPRLASLAYGSSSYGFG